jgi:ABC-type transport system involved in cytochrome c biogenesis permease component
MIILPFIETELRMAARNSRTYWTRVGFGLIGVLVAGMVLTGGATLVFPFLVHILFLGMLFAGMRSTADALSRERRAGTLGLLFFSGLRGFDIALGKMLAGGAQVFYRWLALVPGFATLLLVSNLRLSDWTAMLLALTMTLFFSLSIGLFLSCFFREKKQTEGWAVVVVIVIGLMLPQMRHFPASETGMIGWMQTAASTTPASLMTAVLQNTIWTEAFYGSLGFTFLWGTVLLGLAGWRIGRMWRDENVIPPAGARFKRLRQRFFSRKESGENFRAKTLPVNPVYWLLARTWSRPVQVWSLLVLGALLMFFYAELVQSRSSLPVKLMFPAVTLYLLIKLLATHHATRLVGELKADAGLEFITTTGMSMDDILRGYELALRRWFAGPVFAFSALCLIAFVLTLILPSSLPWELSRFQFVLLIIGSNLMLWADLAAIKWIALWDRLRMQTTRESTSDALVKIFVFPPVVSALAVVVFVESGFFIYALIFSWLAIGLVCALGFGAHSRHKVRKHFYECALPGYRERKGWAAGLGRQAGLWLARARARRPTLHIRDSQS